MTKNQECTGSLIVTKHMQSNSCICVCEYIYASEWIFSVHTEHI